MSESVDAFAELWQKERDKVRLSPPGRSPPRDASHGFGPSAHSDRVMNPPSSRPSTYGSNGQTSSRSDMASNARPFDTHRGMNPPSSRPSAFDSNGQSSSHFDMASNARPLDTHRAMNPPSRPSAYGSNGQSSSHFDMARNTSLLSTDRAIHPLLARSNAFGGRGQSSTRFNLPSNARLSDPDRPHSCLRPLRFDKSGNIESRSENNWDFFPRTMRPSENAIASRPINPTEPNTSDGTSDHSPPRIKLQPLSGTKEEKFKKFGAGILADIRQDSSSTVTRKRPLEISDEDEECPNRPQQSQNTPYGLTIAKSCPPLKQKEATNMDTLVSDTARTEHPTRDFAPRIPTTPQVCPPGSWPEFTPAATRFADVTDNYVPEQAPDPASSWAGLTVRLTRAVGDNMARRSTSTARAVRVVGNHMTRHATNTARAVRVVGNNMTRHATNTARAVRVVGNDMSERATITARRAVNVVGTFKRRIQQVLHRDTNAEHGAEDHRRAAPADSDMPLIDAASVVDDDDDDVMDATLEPPHRVELPSLDAASVIDDDDDVVDATLEPPHPVEMPSLDAASVVVEDDVMGATLEPRQPVEKPSPADGIFELVEIDFGSDSESSPSKSSNTFGHDSAIKPKSLKRAAPESEDPVYPSKRSETRAPVVSTPIRLRGSWLRKMFPAPLLNSHAVAEAKKAYLAGDPTRLKHINYMRMAHRYLPVPIPSIEVKETASEKPKITQPEEVKTKSILKTSSSAVASSSKSSVVDATTISFSDASHEKHTPKPKPSRRVHFPNSPVTGERIITPRNAPPALRTPSPPPRRAAIGHLRHLLDAHARNILSSEDTDVKAITDEEQKENIAPKAHDTTSRDMMSTEVTSHDLMSTERDMLSNEYMRTEDTNIEHVNTNQTTADEVISHEGTSDIAQESNTLSQDPSTQEAEQHPLGRAVSAVSMFYPTPSPIPVGRTESLLAKSWRATVAKNEGKEGKRSGQSQQRPPARILLERPAVRPLSAKWIKRLEDTMAGPPSRKVATTLSGETLTTRDLATCYTPLEWLNDEVINAYMALIIDYLRRTNNNSGRHDKPRYHAFNSFFFSNLRDKGYESVRRWATRAKIGGEALLNVDTVFVPIHDKYHWTLIVVKPCDRTIEHFDSLGGLNKRHVNLIKTWLGGELGEGFVEAEWKVLPSLSPRQDNGSDCGVFLLSTAKAVAINLEPQSYGAPDSPLLRQKIVGELMNGGLDGDFNPVQGRGVML